MKPRPRPYDPFATLPTWQPTRMPVSRPSTLNIGGGLAERATNALPQRSPTEKSVLEQRHPAMANAISLLWGHTEMNDYFDKLWLADGRQTPIDPESMSELMLLAQIHQLLVPRRAPRTISGMYGSAYAAYEQPQRADVWGDVVRRR